MQVNEVMTTDVRYIAPSTLVRDAARMMRDDDVGILPIAEDDRLIGMLTDRDIVVRVVANGSALSKAKVTEAMSPEVLYCFDDESLEAVASNMAENHVHRLPVLNRDKRLVGIVSLGDLANAGAVDEVGTALGRISEH